MSDARVSVREIQRMNSIESIGNVKVNQLYDMDNCSPAMIDSNPMS